MVAVGGGKSGDLVGRDVVAGFLEFVSVARRVDLVVSPGFVVVLCLAERESDAFFALGSFLVPMTVLSPDS